MLLIDLPKHIKCNRIYNLKKKRFLFNSIYTNSKSIKKSSIFLIKKDVKNKHNYIKEAVKNGAIAILTDKYIKEIDVTQFIVSDLDLSLSRILYELKPYKPINSIAITGTNGKTSVTWYISQIFHFNNLHVKNYGTLGYYIDNKKKNYSNLTTPNYDILHQTAFSNQKNNFNYIFEASSHALDQNRINKFPINVAGITNISQDHLDYHKDLKRYTEAKFKLFTKYLNKDGHAVINDKIKDAKKLKSFLNKNIKIITYGKKTSDVYLFIQNNKTIIRIHDKKYILNFNKYSFVELENISCAIACCSSLGIKNKNIISHLKEIQNPPGRLQEVKKKINKFKVFIDYAHTPDALKSVLKSQTILNKKPNLVFGCGGDRDKEKRSKMGFIASKYANKVYITNDNPRNENSNEIRKAILSKCKKGIEVANRKKAISMAINDLNKNDILIIAGKGHEKYQIENNILKPFDDYKIAKNEIQKIK